MVFPKNLTEKEQNKVEELLEQFDFEKAHALFNIMGWTYWDGAPNVERLRLAAKNLLEEVLENVKKDPDRNWIESGRFRAEYHEGNNELGLKLIFEEKSLYLGDE